MKRVLFLFAFVLFLLPFTVNAKEVNIYLFYGNGCPHCAALEEYLNTEYKNDKDLKIYKYEVWYDKDNQKLWKKVQDVTGKEAKGVPYFIIGEQLFQGYNDTSSWENSVDEAIENAKENGYIDDVGVALDVTNKKDKDKTIKQSDKQKNNKDENSTTSLDIPFIGKVNLKNLSLPIIAILIGLVDGFNPCAMWILIFLITMLT